MRSTDGPYPLDALSLKNCRVRCTPDKIIEKDRNPKLKEN